MCKNEKDEAVKSDDEKTKTKSKPRPSAPKKAHVVVPKKDKESPTKKLKKKVDESSSSDSSDSDEPTRRAPGYSLLRMERDRIDRALQSLRRKAEHRLAAAGGKRPTTTVCSILNDALVEFYVDEKTKFETKFGRYLSDN